jgi:hypothetical protein
LRPLTSGWTNTAALIVDSVLVVGVVVVSIYRRPFAWRVWVVFAVGFLANSLLIGANRVGAFGVDLGNQLYYVQAPAYLFLLCAGVAFSLEPSGEPYPLHASPFHESRRSEHLPRHVRRPGPAWVGARPAAVSLVLALYGMAFVFSVNALNAKDLTRLESATSKAYFTSLAGGIRAAEGRGKRVSLADTAVPASIVLTVFAPFNRLSSVLPLLEPDVAVAGSGGATFGVSGDGSLFPLPARTRGP